MKIYGRPDRMFSPGTYERAKPLPAGKPIAPYRAPREPGHAKFRDTPGQQMHGLDDDDPQRIDPAP